MVGASLLVGLLESVLACLADLVALSGVFVVGGDVADAFVEPHRVVVAADAFEFSAEVCGVVERFDEVYLTLRDRLRVFSSRIGGCAVVVGLSC